MKTLMMIYAILAAFDIDSAVTSIRFVVLSVKGNATAATATVRKMLLRSKLIVIVLVCL